MEKIKIRKYFKNNNGKYSITKIMEGTLSDEMVPAIYSIKYDLDTGFYAEKMNDNVKLPEKLFNTGYEGITQKVINNYMESDKASGCIFTGPAGVGKSVTSDSIQHRFITEFNKPVYLVSEPFVGQEFMDFVNDLGDGLFIFDEFEKQYKEQEQNKLLSLFDGADSKVKRLSLIIVNNFYNLSDFYKDRTGRSRYIIEWTTLSSQFINEYLDSELNNKDMYDSIISWIDGTRLVTFDNLEAVVKECNRYPEEDFDELIKYLSVANRNIKTYYRVLEVIDNQPDVPEKLEKGQYEEYIEFTSDTMMELPSSTYDESECDTTNELFYSNNMIMYMDGTCEVGNSDFTIKIREITRQKYNKLKENKT